MELGSKYKSIIINQILQIEVLKSQTWMVHISQLLVQHNKELLVVMVSSMLVKRRTYCCKTQLIVTTICH